jgi:putative membrane protein
MSEVYSYDDLNADAWSSASRPSPRASSPLPPPSPRASSPPPPRAPVVRGARSPSLGRLTAAEADRRAILALRKRHRTETETQSDLGAAPGTPLSGSRFVDGALDDSLSSESRLYAARRGGALKSSASFSFLNVAQGTDRLAELERGPRIERSESALQRFRDRFDPQRWFTYIHSMEGSVVGAIWKRVTFICVFTALVCAFHQWIVTLPEVTLMAHQIGGAVLALFITFRTNSSYQRFYAGVHSFAQLLNTLQGLARVLLSHGVTDSGNAHGSIYISLALINVFPVVAKHDLRSEDSTTEIERFIGAEPIYAGMIRDAPDKCAAIFQALGHEVVVMRRQGVIDSHSLMFIEEKLMLASGLWSECVKIARVPVPYVFAIEGSRIALFFLLTFPIVIVPSFGWATIIAMALLAYEILAIEALGSEIEDPFGRDANDIQLDDFTSEHIEIIAQLARGAHWRNSL